MNINTYIDILILIGVFSNAYVNVKRYIVDKKNKDKHTHKPTVTLCNNNGYVNVETLAKANPHFNFHLEYRNTPFE